MSDTLEARIWTYLRDHGPVNTKELKEAMGTSINAALVQLRNRGYIDSWKSSPFHMHAALGESAPINLRKFHNASRSPSKTPVFLLDYYWPMK